jgi:peptide chain release factor 2
VWRPFGGIFDVPGKSERIAELEAIAGGGGFWNDQDKARILMKEKADLERALESFEGVATGYEDLEVLFELAEEEGDDDSVAEATEQLPALEERVRQLEFQRMLSEEGDDANAMLEINSGAGGKDAADWAQMLQRMYLRWADRQGHKASVVDEQAAEEGGITRCTISIEGPFAYGYLKAEIGVHRLVRISPFDSAARRHTAFASVAVHPAIDDDIDIVIVESDLQIDTYRASGAGGQHVNTTDSAVRITHLPTNTVVCCQNERSQFKNKSTAMKLLKAKLYSAELERRREAAASEHSQKMRIEWGSQIRSYVLHPYRMVKDLRTECETGNVDRFLDGDIGTFMEAWLVQRANEGSAAG